MPTETIAPPSNLGSFPITAEFESQFKEALAKDNAAIAPIKTEPPPEKKPDAAPAPEVTKPETREEDDVPLEIKSTKAADQWKKMKLQHRESISKVEGSHKSEMEKLQSEIKALQSAPKTSANTAELDMLKKERDQMSDALIVLDVERHPKFKEYFDTRINASIAEAKEIAGEYGPKVAEILALPEGQYKREQLEAVFDELSQVQKIELGSVLREIRKVQTERAGEISKARMNHEKITTAQKLEQEQSSQQAKDTFSKAISKANETLAVFKEKEGEQSWNESVVERRNLAESIFNGKLAPEDLAKASIWAASAPAVLQMATGLQEHIKTLEKQIADMQNAFPNLGKGGEKLTEQVVTQDGGFEGLLARAKSELAK